MAKKKAKKKTKKTTKTPTKKGEQERTIDAKARFLSVFMTKANNISESVKAAGISRDVYYQWLRKDSKFKQAVADAKEALYDFAETALIKAIQDGNFPAIKFFLINKAHDRGWQETTNITHDMGGKVEIIHHYDVPPKKRES